MAGVEVCSQLRDNHIIGRLKPEGPGEQLGVETDGSEAIGIRLSTAKRHMADLRARSGLSTEQLIYRGRAEGWLVVPALEPPTPVPPELHDSPATGRPSPGLLKDPRELRVSTETATATSGPHLGREGSSRRGMARGRPAWALGRSAAGARDSRAGRPSRVCARRSRGAPRARRGAGRPRLPRPPGRQRGTLVGAGSRAKSGTTPRTRASGPAGRTLLAPPPSRPPTGAGDLRPPAPAPASAARPRAGATRSRERPGVVARRG